MSVRSYLRYEYEGEFGAGLSTHCNVKLDRCPSTGSSRLILGSNESVTIRDGNSFELLAVYRVSSDAPSLFASAPAPVTQAAVHGPEVVTELVSPSSSNAPLVVTFVALSIKFDHFKGGREFAGDRRMECVFAGYSDGSIREWVVGVRASHCSGQQGLKSREAEGIPVSSRLGATFSGHRSPISFLVVSADNHFLGSGSQDTDIIIWDITSQLGLYRFRGHQSWIQGLAFLYEEVAKYDDEEAAPDLSNKKQKTNSIKSKNQFVELTKSPIGIVSASRDGTLKVWEFITQAAIQTVNQVTPDLKCFNINPTQTKLCVGSASKPQLSIFNLNVNRMISARKKEDEEIGNPLQFLGQIQLPPSCRISQLDFCFDTQKLVQAIDEYRANERSEVKGFTSSILSSGLLTQCGRIWTGSDTLLASSEGVGSLLLGICGSSNSAVIFREFGVVERRERLSRHREKQLRKLKKREKAQESAQEALNKLIGKKGGREPTIILGSVLEEERERAILAIKKLVDEISLIKKDLDDQSSSSLEAEFELVSTLSKLGGKGKRSVFSSSLSNMTLAIGLDDHTLELKRLVDGNPVELIAISQVDQLGHRTVPRNILISHNDELVATITAKAVHIWSLKTKRQVQFFDVNEMDNFSGSGAVTLRCGLFVAGNSHLVIGTDQGDLLLVDLASSSVSKTVQKAFDGKINALAESPELTSFVGVGSDKSLRSFSFEYDSENHLTIKSGDGPCSRLSLPDEGLDVCTVGSNLIAISHLDFSIQLYSISTWKLHLTLYGHKLPITCISSSSDGTLLASGSEDKTIKIWGIDFGDIHKSWHAHDLGLTQVLFLKGSHYLISTAKDNTIRIWDVDRNALLVSTLKGPTSHVRSIKATNVDADRIVAACADFSVRIWTRTSQPLFPQLERERELEERVEAEAVSSGKMQLIGGGSGAVEVALNRPTLRSVESIRKTEVLMEAVDEAWEAIQEEENYRAAITAWQETITDSSKEKTSLEAIFKNAEKPTPPKPRIKLNGVSSSQYLLTQLASIPSTVLQEVVVALPFNYVERLLKMIGNIFENLNSKIEDLLGFENLESIARFVLFIFHLHFRQFISSKSFQYSILQIRNFLRPALLKEKNSIEYNATVLQHLLRRSQQRKLAYQEFAIKNFLLD